MDIEVWQHFEDLSNKLSELKEEPAGEIRNAEISQIAEDVCKEIEKNHKALAQDVSRGSNDEAIVLRIKAQVQALNPELAGKIDQAVKGLYKDVATIEQSVEQAVDKIALELKSLINNPANDDAHIQEVGRFLNKNLTWFRGRSSDGVVLHDRQIAQLFTGLDNLRLKAEKSSSQYAEKLLKYVDSLRPTLSKKLPLDAAITAYDFALSEEEFDDGTWKNHVRECIEENPEHGYEMLRAFIEANPEKPLNSFGVPEEVLNHIVPHLLHVNLEDFDFSGKTEPEIHAFIERFESMKNLKINESTLSSLPLIVRQLESLDCHCSEVTHLPDGMDSLKILNCCVSALERLPDGMSSLKELYCSFRDFTELPGDLDSLEILDCNYCTRLKQLPGNLKKLKKLDCSSCHFTELPRNLDSLEVLGCSYCRELGQLPSNLKKLKKLDCVCCNFTELSGEYLGSLKILRCNGCQRLWGLPGNLKRLKELYCYDCNFTELPRGMTSLKRLDCSPPMVLPKDLPQDVIVSRRNPQV